MNSMIFPGNSDQLAGKLAELKIEFWDELLHEVGDVVDIVSGSVLSAVHNIQAEVPGKNVIVMINTLHNRVRYPII